MAVTTMMGFESNSTHAEPLASAIGTVSVSTTQARSGTYSLRCNLASSAEGFLTIAGGTTGYAHFGLYVATMPSVERRIALGLKLKADGTLTVYNNASTLLGTSATALVTGRWYWIGVRYAAVTAVLLQIDGVDQVTATQDIANITSLGCDSPEASAIDIYIDDFVVDDAGYLPTTTKLARLLPISDNATTAWTAGAGATTNLWDAADNLPPAGVASASETNTTNVESASSTGTANYIANMTTYSTAGIVAGDTVLAVRAYAHHGEDIATGAKTGSIEMTGNPVIAATTFTFGAGAGGAHAASSGGLWIRVNTAVSASPSVTLGTSPTVKLIKTDTTTRTGCVDYVCVYVAYQLAAGQVPYVNPMPPLLAQ